MKSKGCRCMKYDKLIRDKIPSIIKKAGKTCQTRYLEEEDYRRYLSEKLQEEVDEFLVHRNIEELADILEVVYTLGEELGSSIGELEDIRLKKREERGGFIKRLLLLEVID